MYFLSEYDDSMRMDRISDFGSEFDVEALFLSKYIQKLLKYGLNCDCSKGTKTKGLQKLH
jgi:hypothetical protein